MTTKKNNEKCITKNYPLHFIKYRNLPYFHLFIQICALIFDYQNFSQNAAGKLFPLRILYLINNISTLPVSQIGRSFYPARGRSICQNFDGLTYNWTAILSYCAHDE